ncbi:hypothetical protein NL676_006668 [Syzygium grande]|nr:hypothetical protein NL676_006668 [Syzygium grande]
MQHREPEGLVHGVQDSMILKEKSHLVLEAKTHEKKSHNVPDADLSRSAEGGYELQTQQQWGSWRRRRRRRAAAEGERVSSDVERE